MQTRSTHRRSRQSRPWALLLLCLYSLGFFGGTWHAANEGHAVCAHGEVVHTPTGCGTDGSLAPAQDATDRGAEVPGAMFGAGGQDSLDEHEHCGVWISSLRPGLNTHPCFSVLARPAMVRCNVASEPAPRAASFPLFLLAPAHSPPVA